MAVFGGLCLFHDMEKAVVMTGLGGRHGAELMVAMHRIRRSSCSGFCINQMKILISESKPFLDKAKWGRKNDKKIEEIEI